MHVLRWISILLRRSDKHVLLAIVGGLLTGGALAASPYQISQKNREFQPGHIAINRGEALRFINDDGDLLHHAYLTSPTFEFDSNDQKPGSSFTVVFPVAGSFTVRCGIHPKMKLMVNVN
jgi:plastocyanin